MASARVELDREELITIVRALDNESSFALRHQIEARVENELSRKLKLVLRDGTISWMDVPVSNSKHFECLCGDAITHSYPCPHS